MNKTITHEPTKSSKHDSVALIDKKKTCPLFLNKNLNQF